MATGRVPTTANSPLTAKGDLFTYSTAPARLAVGNNGEQIVADSAATTGLRYSATPSASNPILNSSFQVWQRGTANVTTGYAYTADRWQKGNGSYYGVSRQVTGDTTNLPNIQYCARVQRTLADTTTTAMYLAQSMESVNSIPFAGKTATISFYARAGANYSPTSGALKIFFNYGTGTDQNILSGYTGGANVLTQTATLTTTWQRFTYTGSVPSTATELGCFFESTPTGTAGAADYFDVTGVQIDIGSVALPFRTYAATIQGELAACQRYYWRSLFESTYTIIGTGSAYTTGNARIFVPLLVQMRTQPSTLDYGGTTPFGLYDGTAVASTFAGTALTIENGFLSSSKSAVLTVATGGSALTAFKPYFLILNGSGNSSQYIGFGAEL